MERIFKKPYYQFEHGKNGNFPLFSSNYYPNIEFIEKEDVPASLHKNIKGWFFFLNRFFILAFFTDL